MVCKGVGTKRLDKKKGQEAVWARNGVGQNWSETKKNLEKQSKNKKINNKIKKTEKMLKENQIETMLTKSFTFFSSIEFVIFDFW